METDSLKASVKLFTSQAFLYNSQDSKSVVSAALELIEKLPVARNAVLSYLGRKFDEAANCFLQAQVDKINGAFPAGTYSEQSINDSLTPISTSFKNLVNDKTWAPQLSRWAIDLLGHISKKLQSTNAAPISASVNTVEEKLELWLTCSATKILSNITISCFTTIVETSSGMNECIESLLEASIKYAPHFDWVVAHLGSCFPTTIIEQVLQAGFKDYYNLVAQQSSSKFSSAAAILNYLCSQHQAAAQKCISEYLQEVIDKPPPAASTVVQYLLNIGSMSPMVVRAFTSDLSALLTTRNLNKLVDHFIDDKRDQKDLQNLLGLTVHLVQRLDVTSFHVFILLLDLSSQLHTETCAHNSEILKTEVSYTANVILERALVDIHRGTTQNRVINRIKSELPIVKYLTINYRCLAARLHRTPFNLQSDMMLCNLLLAVAWNGGRTVAINVLNNLFSLNRSWLMKTLDEFMRQLLIKYTDLLKTFCTTLLNEKITYTEINNLSTYLNYESSVSEVFSRTIAEDHLRTLVRLVQLNTLRQEHKLILIHIYVKLVLKYSDKYQSLPSTLHTLTQWFVDYVGTDNSKLIKLITDTLVKCSSAPISNLSTILNKLLDFILKPPCCYTLGSRSVPQINESLDSEETLSLSDLNSQLQHRLILPASKSYVFHNQHVGRNVKFTQKPAKPEVVTMAMLQVTALIKMCLDVKNESYTSTDSRILLATMLLEKISPDVITSKTQWADPITHERQLHIRNKLDENPILWKLMSLCCTYKPCFMTIQVFSRCYLNFICSFWATTHLTAAKNQPKELEATCKLLRFVNQLDLLPHPLTDIEELFPHVNTYEMRVVCEVVYRYLQSSISQGLAQVTIDPDDIKLIHGLIQQNLAHLEPDIAIKFLTVN